MNASHRRSVIVPVADIEVRGFLLQCRVVHASMYFDSSRTNRSSCPYCSSNWQLIWWLFLLHAVLLIKNISQFIQSKFFSLLFALDHIVTVVVTTASFFLLVLLPLFFALVNKVVLVSFLLNREWKVLPIVGWLLVMVHFIILKLLNINSCLRLVLVTIYFFDFAHTNRIVLVVEDMWALPFALVGVNSQRRRAC